MAHLASVQVYPQVFKTQEVMIPRPEDYLYQIGLDEYDVNKIYHESRIKDVIKQVQLDTIRHLLNECPEDMDIWDYLYSLELKISQND